MAARPWRPRTMPLFIYATLLWPVQIVASRMPAAYPAAYAAELVIVAAVLWRYRRLVPELGLRFHWLAVPAGLVAAAAWIFAGLGMERLYAEWFRHGPTVGLVPQAGGVADGTLLLRLAGMAVIVPVCEELFFRSLVLRSTYSYRVTALAVTRALWDYPVIGVLLGRRKPAPPPNPRREGIFGRAFRETPLGAISVFSVALGAALWCVICHYPRDWPATIVCAIIYCLLLRHTNSGGGALPSARAMKSASAGAVGSLGPVIWAHAITNTAVWGYCLLAQDWRFM